MLPALLWFAACRPPEGVSAPASHHLELQAVGLPSGSEGDVVRATRAGTLDGISFNLDFQPLAQTGDRIGGVEFGRLRSRSGAPLSLCEGLDASGLWRVGDGWELLTHFECLPAAIYRTRLAADDAGGLHPVSTTAVDLGAVGGGAWFCAGAVTPWGTHLSAEEYEADAAKRLPDGTVSDNFEGYNDLAAWWEGDFSSSHPWDYGWVVEVSPEGPPARRWSMGRFSHEIALPMPDDRSVYLTDDSADGGTLYLFQADRPRDLTSGTLYASRWTAQPDGSYALTWVSLGHSTDAEVQAVASSSRAFASIYDTAALDGDRCPAGYALSASSWGTECLRVRPGMAAAASRLETRRAAAMAGATTELVKSEGLAVAPEADMLLLALSRYSGVALPDSSRPGARDDLQLAANPCGGVWSLRLGPGPAGGPEGRWVATTARPLLEGTPDGTACRDEGIANPDNLAWIPGTGTLVVAEDTARHAHAALWTYDVARQRLTRVLTAPPGAEVSGLRWTPGVAGHAWLSVSIQHPFDGVPSASADRRHSVAGLLGPFPDPASEPR